MKNKNVIPCDTYIIGCKHPRCNGVSKPAYTPTPYNVSDIEIVGVAAALRKHGYHEPAIAAVIRAVNSHEELLADAKANAAWFERGGYATEAANIRKLIAKAEGK